jgi:pSer/pThr/pTyr-binding forkhead associated (FHA) protein
MTDSVLDLLKWTLLGLLYLFFARVLWAVWTEVRTSGNNPQLAHPSPPSPRNARSGDATRAIGADPTFRSQRGRSKRRSDTDTRRGAATKLVVLEPKSIKGQTHLISGEITIGRDPTCTLSIPDDTYISGLHAKVSVRDGQPVIEDLGSTNGSFHNGNRFSGLKLLHPGDRIQIGHTVVEAR